MTRNLNHWSIVIMSGLWVPLFVVILLVAMIPIKAETTPVIRNVQEYGAVGDGITDDTAAINAAAAALQDGDTLYFPSGTYLVRVHGEFSVILVEGVKDVEVLLEKDAIIQLDTVPDDALPQQNRHFIFHLRACENLTFTGGIIYGDRLRYRGSAHCEQGYGIRLSDCRQVTIREVEIAHLRGDGIWLFSDIYVEEATGVKGQCFDITIEDCHVRDCFRNGITLTSVVGCVISRTRVHHISGTAPQAAIDIEAEYPGSFNQDVVIENCHFYENGEMSVAIAGVSRNIRLVSSTLEQKLAQTREGDGLTLTDCRTGMVCVSGKNVLLEDSQVHQLRIYGGQVTCLDTVFDGGGELIPFRVLVTKSSGTSIGRFERCSFRGRGLCTLGGCLVFCHTPPESMVFVDCEFQACGLLPFLGHLKDVKREDCSFLPGIVLGLFLLTLGGGILLLILLCMKKRKKKRGR